MKRFSKLLAIVLTLAFVASTAIFPASAETPSLTYWCQFENNASKSVDNYAKLPMYQELMKRLGINITFLHPPTGMESEQFSLLTASTNLPDIVEYNWYESYPDGPQAAIDDGVILSLNQYLDAGKLPNLAALLAEYPDLAASCRTFEGEYYCFPFVRSTELMEQKGGGLTVRKDVLDQMGYAVPTTIAQWEEVLLAAQKIGYEHPFTAIFKDLHNNHGVCDSTLVGAWGVAYDFYVVDGEVRFGQIQPEYKQYLETMARWFQLGLIDPDILTNDNAALDGKMTGNTAILTSRSPDSGIGVWTKAMQATDPSVELIAAPFPVLNEGDTRYIAGANYRFQGAFSAAITTSCKDVDAALKLLDYAYSPEGDMLFNFGVEGVSFEYDAQGKPQFNAFIKDNPNGLTLKEAMILYCRNSSGGPFVKSAGPILSQRTYKNQYDAPLLWYKSVDWSRNLPRMVYSGEESVELNDVMNEINTITEEMTVKIIIGDKSLDYCDEYVREIEAAGIADALKIVQTAYDRQMGK